MTNAEAIKMAEADLKCMERDTSGQDEMCNSHKCDECSLNYERGNMGEQKEWLRMAIQALEQTQWIPIEWKPFGKNGYPKPEDEYKNFLTTDDKGEITIQEFLLSLDEEPQPYFTGMRNIVAYMPLPEVYKEK